MNSFNTLVGTPINNLRGTINRSRGRMTAWFNRSYNQSPLLWEVLRGWMRAFVILFFFVLAMLLLGWPFPQTSFDEVVKQLRAAVPLYNALPPVVVKLAALIDFTFRPVWEGGAFVFNPLEVRALFLPLLAFIGLTYGAARYVQDVYNLSLFFPALRYVLSSMFAAFYPMVMVDAGQTRVGEGDVNTLVEIGGPGHVVVQPGNSVLFRSLLGRSRFSVNQTFFAMPFERIGMIVDLDDQQDVIAERAVMTRDGIMVRVRDVVYRFRAIPDVPETGWRTPLTPYPLSLNALTRMASNLAVNDQRRQVSWRMGVQNLVGGFITSYINSRTIDFLTAPARGGQDPRADMRAEAFRQMPGMLNGIGAQIIFFDAGHIDIVEDLVDNTRLEFWQADWEGGAEVARAHADALRKAYQELGRAEGQAQMVISIAQALREAGLPGNVRHNLRTIVLMRAAQMLDAIGEQNRGAARNLNVPSS